VVTEEVVMVYEVRLDAVTVEPMREERAMEEMEAAALA
jgi:hypothetical protein